MVEPAPGGPSRHPRDGRGESLSPGAARKCGARQHINPVVSCRVRAPEIRRDFSRQGAVGISATSPERNPTVHSTHAWPKMEIRGWGQARAADFRKTPRPLSPRFRRF